MTERRKCIGTKRNGQPCVSYVHGDSSYCVFHDPDIAVRRKEWRTRGAHRTNSLRRDVLDITPLKSLDELQEIVGKVVVGVATKALPHSLGDTVSSLSQRFIDIEQIKSLQKQLKEAEELLKQQQSQQTGDDSALEGLI